MIVDLAITLGVFSIGALLVSGAILIAYKIPSIKRALEKLEDSVF